MGRLTPYAIAGAALARPTTAPISATSASRSTACSPGRRRAGGRNGGRRLRLRHHQQPQRRRRGAGQQRRPLRRSRPLLPLRRRAARHTFAADAGAASARTTLALRTSASDRAAHLARTRQRRRRIFPGELRRVKVDEGAQFGRLDTSGKNRVQLGTAPQPTRQRRVRIRPSSTCRRMMRSVAIIRPPPANSGSLSASGSSATITGLIS